MEIETLFFFKNSKNWGLGRLYGQEIGYNGEVKAPWDFLFLTNLCALVSELLSLDILWVDGPDSVELCFDIWRLKIKLNLITLIMTSVKKSFIC